MYAEAYNKCKPPKQVDFVAAFVLQLLDREGEPLCAVEKVIYINTCTRRHMQIFSCVYMHIIDGRGETLCVVGRVTCIHTHKLTSRH